MAIIRNNQLIKETITVNGSPVMDEVTANFIIKRYFHYGIIAMMHGHSFGAVARFSIKMVYTLYSQIPKIYRKLFTYSSKMFGYTFLPVLSNSYAKRYGYNFMPDPGILKKMADFADTDQIYKLVKK